MQDPGMLAWSQGPSQEKEFTGARREDVRQMDRPEARPKAGDCAAKRMKIDARDCDGHSWGLSWRGTGGHSGKVARDNWNRTESDQ